MFSCCMQAACYCTAISLSDRLSKGSATSSTLCDVRLTVQSFLIPLSSSATLPFRSPRIRLLHQTTPCFASPVHSVTADAVPSAVRRDGAAALPVVRGAQVGCGVAWT